MRIHAGSFGLDMNALLNQMNQQSVHGYYNKMIHNTANKVQNINNKIIQEVKDRKGDGQTISSQINQQIDILRQNDENMWNHAVPQSINDAMNQAINSVPSSTTYYYPMGQFPSDPSDGDVVWQTPDPDDYGSNNITAVAYRYYKNSGWQIIKGANQNVYGANILGANIKGGMISGAVFRSNQQGNNGAAFSVNRDGRIYAQDFVADLQHQVTKDEHQLNPCAYDGYFENGQGYSLTNGIVTMKATVAQQSGGYIWANNPLMEGATYLEPGYLKLRYDHGPNEFVRTDLRAGNLEIAGNTWNNNKGIRMGYWAPHLYPHLSIGDWDFHESPGGSDDLWVENTTGNAGIIELNGPVNVRGTLTAGKGKTIATGDDLTRIHNALNNHQTEINSANSTISDQGTVLDDHGNTLDQHSAHLTDHDNHLSTHDTQIADLNGSIQSQDNTISNLNSKVDINNEHSLPNIHDSTINLQNNDIWSNYQPMGVNDTSLPGTVWINNGVQPVDIRAGDVYSHGNPISSDRSLKKEIKSTNSKAALTAVLGTDIKSWRYKDDQNDNKPKNIGPIIDDQNNNKHQKYYTPNNLIESGETGDAFIQNNAISYLFLSIQELEKQNSRLTQRVAKLEFERK